MESHRQVIRNRLGRETLVDEGIADLLQLLWDCGCDTYNSCQENRPEMAWIEFATTEDCARFLNFVANHPADNSIPFWETLYGRITGHGADDDWEYEVLVVNLGEVEEMVDGEIVATIKENNFAFMVSVYFPISDILPLIDILTRK
jgi:hypothetical protein